MNTINLEHIGGLHYNFVADCSYCDQAKLVRDSVKFMQPELDSRTLPKLVAGDRIGQLDQTYTVRNIWSITTGMGRRVTRLELTWDQFSGAPEEEWVFTIRTNNLGWAGLVTPERPRRGDYQ